MFNAAFISMPITWPLGASRSWPWQASNTSHASCSSWQIKACLRWGKPTVSSWLASGAGQAAAIAIGGAWGVGLLVFVWTAGAAGGLLNLLHPGEFEALSISAYLLLGWTILPAIDRLIAAVSLLALVLLSAGGIFYTVGVLFYCWDRLPYNRAIWHGFVLAGATCHYIAVLDV